VKFLFFGSVMSHLHKLVHFATLFEVSVGAIPVQIDTSLQFLRKERCGFFKISFSCLTCANSHLNRAISFASGPPKNAAPARGIGDDPIFSYRIDLAIFSLKDENFSYQGEVFLPWP